MNASFRLKLKIKTDNRQPRDSRSSRAMCLSASCVIEAPKSKSITGITEDPSTFHRHFISIQP
jgi:hypothetical protein